MSPRFTIITPTLNRRDMLAAALDSVARQNWPNLEHIVVDGGSTDGTLEWLAAVPGITLVAGADSGVYDAINKGLALATGEVIGLLNSDDYYFDGAFRAAAQGFDGNPHADVVCGSAVIIDEAGIAAERLAEPAQRLQAIRAALAGVCIPNARFFRRRVFERIGTFDPTLRLVADRDFVLRLLEEGVLTLSLDLPVYAYRRHAGSLTFDAGRSQALPLRSELLQLAARWSQHPTASSDTRRLASILEGRSRIGILRDAAGKLSSREILSVLTVSQGRLSLRPVATMASAIVDRIVTGGRADGRLL